MGFLNLSAWRPVGGSVPAERRATAVLAQSPKYYYDHIGDFQASVDLYVEEEGHRPATLADLYLWQLQHEGALDDDGRALDLADFMAYYDIEQHSQLAMVAIDPDKPTRAKKLLEARHLFQLKRRAEERRKARPAGGDRAASRRVGTAHQPPTTADRESAAAAGQTTGTGTPPPADAPTGGAAA